MRANLVTILLHISVRIANQNAMDRSGYWLLLFPLLLSLRLLGSIHLGHWRTGNQSIGLGALSKCSRRQ